MRSLFGRLHRDEDGHGAVLLPNLGGALGAILLTVGAAANEDGLTIAGGIVLAAAIVLSGVARHILIDYEIYARLDSGDGSADGD